MANTYPYSVSIGGLVSTIEQLRKAFPSHISAKTLQQWGYAPNNESYILNVLRFLELVDDEGKKEAEAGKVFSLHRNEQFHDAFSKLIRDAYSEVFELHGDVAWTLDRDQLISFFRATDESSATVGKRQAATFQALAGLAGHGTPPKAATPLTSNTKKKGSIKGKSAKKGVGKAGSAASTTTGPPAIDLKRNQESIVGLTVRIELNLPSTTDQKVYDGIFKSVREHLLDD